MYACRSSFFFANVFLFSFLSSFLSYSVSSFIFFHSLSYSSIISFFSVSYFLLLSFLTPFVFTSLFFLFLSFSILPFSPSFIVFTIFPAPFFFIHSHIHSSHSLLFLHFLFKFYLYLFYSFTLSAFLSFVIFILLFHYYHSLPSFFIPSCFLSSLSVDAVCSNLPCSY